MMNTRLVGTAVGLTALIATLTACSPTEEPTPAATSDAATTSTEAPAEPEDSRTAAEKVAEECAADANGVTLSADGENLRISGPFVTENTDGPFDLAGAFDTCVDAQGFLPGTNLDDMMSDTLSDDNDAAFMNLFGEDGLVVVADGAFVTMRVFDGDEPLTFEAFLGAALAGGDSEDWAPPESWSVVVEMGPDDGTYTDNASGSGSGEATSATAEFGTAYVYADGLSVTISEPEPFEPSEWAFAEGDHFIAFTVVIENGTEQAFDPIGFTTTLASGGKEADEVFDTENGLEGAPSTSVQPGKSVEFIIGYGVADPDDITMDVSPDFWDHQGFTLVK